MAALMHLRHVFVLTHDSIGLGEDGPTHQPVEHGASLRLIPNLDVWRPCDTVETAVAWCEAVQRRDGPSALLLSRQNVAFARRDAAALARCRARRLRARRLRHRRRSARGRDRDRLGSPARARRPRGARRRRHRRAGGVDAVARSASTARRRTTARRVLPRGVPRVAVEAGVTDGWRKYVGAADDPTRGRGGPRPVRRVGARPARCSSTSASRPTRSRPRSAASPPQHDRHRSSAWPPRPTRRRSRACGSTPGGRPTAA